MRLRLLLLVLLLSASLGSPASGAVIIEHHGDTDPLTEGWTDNPASPDVQTGGNETTGSGLHAFWQIDHTTGNTPNAGVHFVPTVQQLDFDWRLEASVRVVDSPDHCCFPAGLPFTVLSVRDGLTTWHWLLGNDVVGFFDTAPAPFTAFARSAAVDTRSDYHEYVIQFRQNGPGTEDDTVDLYYDGTLLFPAVTRAELQSISEVSVNWGPGARDQTSIANYKRIQFISADPPVPTENVSWGQLKRSVWGTPE